MHVNQLTDGIDDLVKAVVVQIVDDLFVLVVQIGPDAEGALPDMIVGSFDD